MLFCSLIRAICCRPSLSSNNGVLRTVPWNGLEEMNASWNATRGFGGLLQLLLWPWDSWFWLPSRAQRCPKQMPCRIISKLKISGLLGMELWSQLKQGPCNFDGSMAPARCYCFQNNCTVEFNMFNYFQRKMHIHMVSPRQVSVLQWKMIKT